MEHKDIVIEFVNATTSVLQTMVGITPTVGKAHMLNEPLKYEDYSAYVHGSGAANKKISIGMTFSKHGAYAITKAMFEDELENNEEDVLNIVGELVNIISGDVRRRLADGGITFDGNTPTLLWDEGHKIPHLANTPVTIIHFSIPEGEFRIEFCVTNI